MNVLTTTFILILFSTFVYIKANEDCTKIELWANVSLTTFCKVLKTHQLVGHIATSNNTWLCYNKTTGLFRDDCTSTCAPPDLFGGSEMRAGWLNGDLTSGISLGFYCEIWNISSADCNSTIINDKYQCNGEGGYCDIFENRTSFHGKVCETNYNCYCKQGMLTSKIAVDCGYGQFIPLGLFNKTRCIGSNTTRISFFSDQPKVLLSKSDVIGFDDSAAPIQMFLSVTSSAKPRWTEALYVINLPNNTKYSYEVKVFEINTTKSRSVVRIDITGDVFTEAVYLSTEEGNFLMWTNDITRYGDGGNITLTTSDFCHAGFCSYCPDDLEWMHCRMSNFGWLKIALIVFFIVVFCCFSPWICAMMCGSYRCMKCWCKIPMMCIKKCLRASKSHMKKRKETMKKLLEEGEFEAIEMQDEVDESDSALLAEKEADRLVELKVKRQFKTISEEETNEMKKLEKQGKVRGSLGKKQGQALFVLFIFFSFPLLSRAQCTAKSLSSSDVKTCVKHNSTHLSCSYVPKLAITLDSVGSTFCLDILDNETTPVDQISVTFNSYSAVNHLVTKYFTTDYNVEISASRQCFLKSCCTYGTYHKCEKWLENQAADPNPCGLFPDRYMTAAGKSGCVAGQGCAGNGCFSCAQTCGYWRWIIDPVGGIYNVSAAGLTTYQAEFTIKSSHLNETKINTVSPYYEDDNMKVSIVGVFTDFQLSFDKGFVIGANGVHYADISPSNNPAKGIVGDVQAGDPTAFTTPALFDVISMADIVTVEGGSDISASWGTAGIKNMIVHEPMLPLLIDGLYWQYVSQSGTLKASIQRNEAAVLEIDFKHPIQFYELDSDTCPDLKFHGMKGCYNCAGGASVFLLGRSSCFPGSCLVLSEDTDILVFNNAVFLDTEPTLFNVTIQTDLSQVNSKFKIVCNGGNQEFTVYGILESDVNIYNNGGNQTYVSEHAGSGTSGWDFASWLGDLFNIGHKWAMIIASILIVLAVVVIFVLFFVIMVKLVRAGKLSSISKNSSVVQIMKETSGYNAAKGLVKSGKQKYKPVKLDEEEE